MTQIQVLFLQSLQILFDVAVRSHHDLVRLKRILENECAGCEGVPQEIMMPLLKVILAASIVIFQIISEEGEELVAQEFDLEFLTSRLHLELESV